MFIISKYLETKIKSIFFMQYKFTLIIKKLKSVFLAIFGINFNNNTYAIHEF